MLTLGSGERVSEIPGTLALLGWVQSVLRAKSLTCLHEKIAPSRVYSWKCNLMNV